MRVFDKVQGFFNPSQNPDIERAFNYQPVNLPTLWLLGTAGAGKSSLIRAVTNDINIKVGDGFRPCTSTSHSYDFPVDKPLMRFLDTRGLAEANYNADEDIAECQSRSSALIVVMKTEELEQSSVLNALKQIKKTTVIKQILLVHTGIHLVESVHDRQRCIAHNQDQVNRAWGSPVNAVEVDFDLEGGAELGIDSLKSSIADLLPILSQIYLDEEHANLEEKNFNSLKAETLWYSTAAATSDAFPAIGLVSVPLIQGKLLHSLANQYGIEWNKLAISEFIGVLGIGFAFQYASKLGLRQLVKLIPVYGQTVGAATAAIVSFCSTYALGRVACKYMFHKSKGEPVSEDEIKELYRSAFESIKKIARSETK